MKTSEIFAKCIPLIESNAEQYICHALQRIADEIGLNYTVISNLKRNIIYKSLQGNATVGIFILEMSGNFLLMKKRKVSGWNGLSPLLKNTKPLEINMHYKDFKFKRVISEKRCMFTATHVSGIPFFRKEELVDLVLTERWYDSELVDVTNNLHVPSKYTVGLRDLYEIAKADSLEVK